MDSKGKVKKGGVAAYLAITADLVGGLAHGQAHSVVLAVSGRHGRRRREGDELRQHRKSNG
jgi:hypothetical protein